MKVLETRLIKQPDFLKVLVLVAIAEGVHAWYTQDFFDDENIENALTSLEKDTIISETWEPCSVEDWTAGLDPRTDEQKAAHNEQMKQEMHINITAVLETVKPHIIDVLNHQSREKYIAAALTGLLASGSYHHDEASAVVGIATCYADAAILATQEAITA